MPHRFFWIDLEMTGLDDKTDTILEIAAVVTDLDFNSIEEFHRVIFQPPHALETMNDWCKKTHGATGLTVAVATGTPIDQAEQDLVAFAKRHFSAKEKIVLAGNSVGNDRRFIDAYLKNFAGLLHYRLIDVSSFKEIFREKYGVEFEKKDRHRAMDDIYECIAELKAYLTFVTPINPSTLKGSPLKKSL